MAEGSTPSVLRGKCPETNYSEKNIISEVLKQKFKSTVLDLCLYCVFL